MNKTLLSEQAKFYAVAINEVQAQIDRLEGDYNWVQDSPSLDVPLCACAGWWNDQGSIYSIFSHSGIVVGKLIESTVREVLGVRDGKYLDLAQYNDAEGREKEEVLAILDEVLQVLGQCLRQAEIEAEHGLD